MSDGGNRTVFKPSPLKALKTAAAAPASAAPQAPPAQAANPNEVTAVPLAKPRTHDDLTTFDPGASLPPVPPLPAAGPSEAPMPQPTGEADPRPPGDRRVGTLWILALLAVLIVAGLWLGLPGML